jgi:hypothetical protein
MLIASDDMRGTGGGTGQNRIVIGVVKNYGRAERLRPYNAGSESFWSTAA